MSLRVSSVIVVLAAAAQVCFGPACFAQTPPSAAQPILLERKPPATGAAPAQPVLMAIKAPRGFEAPDDYVTLAEAPLIGRRAPRSAGGAFSLGAARAGAVGDVITFYERSQWRPTVRSGGVAVEWRISFGARQN